jgi:DNA-binding CsgD family transcriptional regulator
MKYDINDKMFYLKGNKIFHLLQSDMTYTEIANKYYSRNKNKFIYNIRKILKELGLKNREQLINFAIINDLL